MRAKTGPLLIVHLDGQTLTAVEGQASGGRVRVVRWACVERANTSGEPDETGAWIARVLREAGMHATGRRRGTVLSLPRGEAVLKRFVLPAGVRPHEAPGAVRLQLLRQVSVPTESAVVDYVPVLLGHNGSGGEGGTGMTVLAATVQGEAVESRRALARQAGLKLRRIALRSEGAAALLAVSAQRRDGATLGIAFGPGSVEFIVLEGGQIALAREMDLAMPGQGEDREGYVRRIAVEAKRTAMAYRVMPGSGELESVGILGSGLLAAELKDACEEVLDLGVRVEDLPAMVDTPGEMGARERTLLAPLIGLLAQGELRRESLDFLSPRKAPDASAARRQRVLAAALLLILAGGGAYTYAKMDMQRAVRAYDEARSEYEALDDDYAEYLRTRARVEHLDRWKAARADWLTHLEEIGGKLPPSSEAVLTRLSGEAESGVLFNTRTKIGPVGWSSFVRSEFQIAGRVEHRGVADALRAVLVGDQRYTVESTGADLPNRFSFRLTSLLPSPRAERPNESDDARANGEATNGGVQ